jgi:CBS domain-containing protein
MAERYSIQDAHRYDEEWRYGPNLSRGERYGEHGRAERGFIERAGDEVRSWLGDEEAERRRMDERFERQHDSAYTRPQGRFGDVRARDVMTRNLAIVHAWDSVEHAARLMGECDCGSLPVINESGRLVGIVTDRDIAVRIAGRGKDPQRTRVSECMSGDLAVCHEYDSIESCMRQMSRHQIRRLPIVDDRDRLRGIVSQSDLARHAGTHPGWGERRAFADVLCAVSQPTHRPRR